MRADATVLDLHTIETAIRGEFAYPMVARGRLVGALVLGRKNSGESYAPDESAAIASLAHSVAGALDVLDLKKDDESQALLREILGALRALPETLAGTFGAPARRTEDR